MIITLTLVLFGLAAVVFLLRIAKGCSLAQRGEAGHHSLRPVDIDAFRNLIDPAEEEYLRLHLRPAEFRKRQRERLRAVLAYILCVAANAAVLIRMGEAARLSPEPSIAQAGERLVDNAIRLRLYSFQAVVRLYGAILLPSARVSAGAVAENYERLSALVSLLGRLQSPRRSVSAAL